MEINEKLEIFYRAAIDAANEQSGTMLEEQAAAYRESLAEYERERQAGSQTRVRIAKERVKKEVNRQISEELLQLRREYHQRQEEKKTALFALVEEKLNAYRNSEEYRALLGEKVKRALEFAKGEAVTVYLDPEDEPLKAELERECGCDLAISDRPFGGGIRVMIPPKNVMVDESFAGRLAEEREKFSF